MGDASILELSRVVFLQWSLLKSIITRTDLVDPRIYMQSQWDLYMHSVGNNQNDLHMIPSLTP
jgi:hypothetical protein